MKKLFGKESSCNLCVSLRCKMIWKSHNRKTVRENIFWILWMKWWHHQLWQKCGVILEGRMLWKAHWSLNITPQKWHQKKRDKSRRKRWHEVFCIHEFGLGSVKKKKQANFHRERNCSDFLTPCSARTLTKGPACGLVKASKKRRPRAKTLTLTRSPLISTPGGLLPSELLRRTCRVFRLQPMARLK